MAAKMKFFGKAMQKVRKAERDKNGKLKDKNLGRNTRELLARVRSGDYAEADMIAKNILDGRD